MCGVAGTYSYRPDSPAVDERELLLMREAMHARGPDGAGLWVSSNRRVGLAHRRLSIIDLSEAGAQPMASADGRLTITFNGEIYNYRELRRELEAEGYSFRSTSDTEVLLCLYAEHGAEMVQRLRGMYAFGIWDAPNRRLFLARDPFGIKPLYYSDSGGVFRFASQVKALLRGGGIDDAPEPAGHVGFFLWGYVPEPYTLYRNIRALPAGSTLSVEERGAGESARFFSVAEEYGKAADRIQQRSAHETREVLRESLTDSVRHHLVADVPVGVFLSSGLDSGTVTALASELAYADLRTVTLGFHEFRGMEDDETVLADTVARHYSVRHETRWIARSDFRADLSRMLAAMDQPSTDGVNTYFVSKVAAEAGMKVALSGLGGDELFGGYPSFRDVPRLARWAAAGRTMPGLGRGFRWVSAPIVKRFTSPKYAGLLEYGGSFGGAYLLRRGLYMPWELPEIMDAEAVREGWRELQPLLRLEDTARGLTAERQIVSALELSWYMRNQLLRDADWAGMAHSLEIRVPFLDAVLFRRLAALTGMRVPPGKLEMAGALRKALPDEVLRRRKTGFNVPVREWLQWEYPYQEVERGLRSWARRVNELPESLWNAQAKQRAAVKKVLVYRLGSLGDTAVAMPSFHLVARAFPHAERRVLTNIPVSIKAAPIHAILGESGITHGYFAYPQAVRDVRKLMELRREIMAWRPETLVYLTASRGRLKALRDALFFRLCGIRAMVGVPYTRDRQENRKLDGQGGFEPEASRLARCLASLGDAKLYDPASWDLHLTDTERGRAAQVLAAWDGKDRFIACSAGTKIEVNDWGAENWARLMEQMSSRYADRFGLVLVGSDDEFSRGEYLARFWSGPALNLCGQLTPRESAAVLARAAVFVGHDSGPMHLAASAGVPCVAVFSARNMPGVWFPRGERHKVIYHQVECAGCKLEICSRYHKKCISSISVGEVRTAAEEVMPQAQPC